MSTFRLGLFIVATLAVLGCGVFLISNKRAPFKSGYPVRAEFVNVAGLREGADVRVGGLHKGTVESINLPARPDQKVTVTMEVSNTTHGVLRKDSVASVKSDGLMGDKYVEISFGSVDAPGLKNGDTIGGQPPVDISDIVAQTGAIMAKANVAVKNISETAGNLDAITESVRQGKGTAGELINNDAVYKKMEAAATDLQENMEALKHNFLLRGFFKSRGYEDSDDLKKHEIAELPRVPSEKVFNYDAKQIFAKPGAARLKNTKMLDETGQFLQGGKFGLVVVAARAGEKGDSDKVRQLTEARAAVIREYLVNHYRVDDTRIRTMGEGKTADTGDDGDVQIIVYPVALAGNTPPDSK